MMRGASVLMVLWALTGCAVDRRACELLLSQLERHKKCTGALQ